MKQSKKLLPRKVIQLSNGKTVEKPLSYAPAVWLVLILATWLSIRITGFDLRVIAERGNQFFVILGQMFPPDNYFQPNWGYLSNVWTPLIDTIKMSLLGSLVGALLAIPFAVIASSNIVKSRLVISLARLFIGIVRTLPTLVVALIATYVFGLGTMAGTTAIAVFTFAYMGKILYEQIETVEMGAFEAMEAMGSTKLRAFLGAIVPQVLPSYLSNTLFCFEGNVRYASILGYVGAGGLGLILNEKIGWREYSSVGTILAALFVTVFLIETLSRRIRDRLT